MGAGGPRAEWVGDVLAAVTFLGAVPLSQALTLTAHAQSYSLTAPAVIPATR